MGSFSTSPEVSNRKIEFSKIGMKDFSSWCVLVLRLGSNQLKEDIQGLEDQPWRVLLPIQQNRLSHLYRGRGVCLPQRVQGHVAKIGIVRIELAGSFEKCSGDLMFSGFHPDLTPASKRDSPVEWIPRVCATTLSAL